ncbi:hypothetical protein VXQ47_03330 [Acinetobacter pittii]|uniref:hypothetical protein n=1 Tax=Acinetobacter pittii TaxID=48296 RepID=UPI002DB7DCB9|nr:hypothetical protein [Acinetobacter pittii]MEB7640451.1 hypothetical protein [Acinetobacter pittii]
MANGFPNGNFRIVNKETGACIASAYGGQSHGVETVSRRGQTAEFKYSHTNDRLFMVHDKVKNIDEELWYFDSHVYIGRRENKLFNKVSDIRSNWVLGAIVNTRPIEYKLRDHDLENFLSLLPKQDEETLAHLRTSDCLDIIELLKTLLSKLIYTNSEETIQSELLGKLDDKKFDDYLNNTLVDDLVEKSRYGFEEDLSFRFGYYDSAHLSEKLYKIFVASSKLDILNQQSYSSYPVEFRLRLSQQNIITLLEKLKKERFWELSNREEIDDNIEDPIQEATKIIQELRNDLDLHTFENNFNTARKIWQTGLKSNESFEQIKAALKSMNNIKLQAVNRHSGKVFLQGAGLDYQTSWAFEDGYIFVEGKPDAVLTHSSGSTVCISHRSNDPRQRWELK